MSISRLFSKARSAVFVRPKTQHYVPPERIHVISCIGVELENALVAHFADHYCALGVPSANFHLVLNATHGDAEEVDEASQILRRRGINPEEIWIEPYTSDAMWQKRRDIQRRCVPKGHWIISADADELHEYPTSLTRFLGECESNGVTCVDGVFIDRVTEDGSFASIDEQSSLQGQFPTEAMVQGRLVEFGEADRPFGSVKLMAFDASLLPARGGHGLIDNNEAHFLFGRHLPEYPQITSPNFRFNIPLRVHHFKWHAGLVNTLERRLGNSGVSAADIEYGQKLLRHINESGGRINYSRIAIRDKSRIGAFIGWRSRVNAIRCIHYSRQAASAIRRKIAT